MSITKSVNVTTITAGGTAVYSITATNSSKSAAGTRQRIESVRTLL